MRKRLPDRQFVSSNKITASDAIMMEDPFFIISK
jgi:hypothetical protein